MSPILGTKIIHLRIKKSYENKKILSYILDLVGPNLVVPIYDKISSKEAHKYVDEVEKINSMSEKDILNYQLTRLNIICKYAKNNTEYYKNILAKNKIREFDYEEFSKIPILCKNDIRNFWTDMIAKPFDFKRLRKSATGGTVSSPVSIYMDKDSHQRRQSATITFDRWVGYGQG